MLKFLQKKFLFSLFFCAIQLHCLHAKKFGGGGGGFRGGGAARANPPPAGGHFGGGGAPVGGGQPHFAGGGGAGAFHGPTGGGGFHPPPAGGFHGPPMSAGSGPGRFGTGTGLGSSGRAGTFTSALAGAAVGTVGGLVAFEAGKAIIHSFDRPFQHDGRDYYLDEKYAKKRHGEIQCKMPWDTLFNQSLASNQSTNGTAPEQSLANATFPNGSRPKEIVWTCKEHVEICCGMDCCPNPQHTPSSSEAKSGGGMGTVGKVFLGILVVALLFCCCCALLTYTSCRSILDSCLPGSNNNQNYDQTHKFEGAGDNAHNPSGQAYPMQPYYPPPPAPNNYPAQPQATAVYPQTYPAQPQAQAGYPPNPTSYPQAPGY